MTLNTSPSVNITETTPPAFIPTQTNEVAAFVGHFERGPTDFPIWITNIDQFKFLFGRGIDEYAQDWYQVYNFLQYASGIYVIRSIGYKKGNANNGSDIFVNTYEDWLDMKSSVSVTGIRFIAQTPGIWGNLLKVAVITKQDWDNNVILYNSQKAQNVFSFFEEEHLGVVIYRGNDLMETFYKSYTNVYEIDKESLYVYVKTDTELSEYVEIDYIKEFNSSSGIWEGGSVIGSEGTFEALGDLENYSDLQVDLGANLETMQQYIESNYTHYDSSILSFNNGYGALPSSTDFSNSYDILSDTISYNIDIIIGNQRINELAINLAETRKDCIAFIGIPTEIVDYLELIMGSGNPDEVLYTENNNIIVLNEYKTPSTYDKNSIKVIEEYLSTLPKSEYADFTFNIKKQLDIYTNTYKLINIAGDVAGLKSRASLVSPWTISAGLENGIIKNMLKPFITLTPTQEDYFYKLGLNLVKDNVLQTQKTFTTKKSAFSRVSIRSLFNHLEKQTKSVLNKYLFEENVLRTRQAIGSDIKRYLENVQVHKGVYGARVYVYANENNHIVVEISVKPTYAAEYITLRITDTGTKTITSIL